MHGQLFSKTGIELMCGPPIRNPYMLRTFFMFSLFEVDRSWANRFTNKFDLMGDPWWFHHPTAYLLFLCLCSCYCEPRILPAFCLCFVNNCLFFLHPVVFIGFFTFWSMPNSVEMGQSCFLVHEGVPDSQILMTIMGHTWAGLYQNRHWVDVWSSDQESLYVTHLFYVFSVRNGSFMSNRFISKFDLMGDPWWCHHSTANLHSVCFISIKCTYYVYAIILCIFCVYINSITFFVFRISYTAICMFICMLYF